MKPILFLHIMAVISITAAIGNEGYTGGNVTRATIRNVSNPTGECVVRNGETTSKINFPLGVST